MKKIYVFSGRKISPQSPKTEFGEFGEIWSCGISIDRKFYIDEENKYF
jgi:hypothetical protein